VDYGATWIVEASVLAWVGVSVSATGQYQVAVVANGQIWVSSDFGNVWTAVASSLNWRGVCISSSGQYITAVVNGGQIYVSLAIPAGTVDQYSYSLGKLNNVENPLYFSSTWNKVATFTNNSSIITDTTLSSDGKYILAAGVFASSPFESYYIFLSSNYGTNWTSVLINNVAVDFNTVSMSSTGQYQAASATTQTNTGGNGLFVSNNYGISGSWLKKILIAVTQNYRCVGVSAIGQYQIVGVDQRVYLSSDYGNTWNSILDFNSIYSSSSPYCRSCAISPTGKYQVLGVPATNISSTFIYLSSDSGTSWNNIYNTGSSGDISVTISSSGQYISAIDSAGIYVSSNYGVSFITKTGLYTSGSKISMSPTGQHQIISSKGFSTTNNRVKTSVDYGITWIDNVQVLASGGCTGVSFSSNGLKLAIGTYENSSGGLRISELLPLNAFTFNLDTGTTFFLTGQTPTANYSANFTISTLNTANTYLITVINKTSSVHQYYCNSVKINGTGRTLLYTGSRLVTGAAQTNQEFIMFYNSTTSAWVVLTNIKVFKA
jgi:hypothetical protein